MMLETPTLLTTALLLLLCSVLFIASTNTNSISPLTSPITPLQSKSLGFYVLIADDTESGYTSKDNWQPYLYDYQVSGLNLLWLTFINPSLMPAVPPAMANLAKCKGSGRKGCPSSNTPVIFSIGGEAYSKHTSQWPWLASASAAKAMAQEVAQWSTLYACDGIDLDLEGPAGNVQSMADNLVLFTQTLHALNPSFIVTNPVYGYPQITSENAIVNQGYYDTVGLMVYANLESLRYVPDYGNATAQGSGWPITVDVPYSKIVPGIQGPASADFIQQMADNIVSQQLGGFMVWFASVFDATRNKPALTYGANDATFWNYSTGASWEKALKTMQ